MMQIELDFADGRHDLVVTTAAGGVHRYSLYQALTSEQAKAVASDPRLPKLLQLLEQKSAAARCTNASPALEAVVATSLQLLQESVMQRHLGSAPDFADDEHTRILNHEAILASATEVMGSEERALAWMARPAIGLDGQRPVDLLATAEGAQVVEDFIARLRYGVYT